MFVGTPSSGCMSNNNNYVIDSNSVLLSVLTGIMSMVVNYTERMAGSLATAIGLYV